MKITGLLGNVPKQETSHNRAYAMIWGSVLNVEVETGTPDYNDDKVYIYLGINHKPDSINLFGGLEEALYDRFEAFLNSNAEFFVLDYEMPDFAVHFKNRLDNKTTYHKWTEEFLNKITEKCKDIKVLTMKDFVKDELVIGDSHSLSMTPQGVPVFRLDAKTLYGALKDNFLLDMIPETVKKLTLQFGSIDIRHHIFRQSDPLKAIDELTDSYAQKVQHLRGKGIDVTVCSPVPIELEERKMAQTTLYKKEPFIGNRIQRLTMTLKFIKSMREKIGQDSVLVYPTEWYKMSGEDYASEIMESGKNLPGKGIHVGFPHYRINSFGI